MSDTHRENAILQAIDIIADKKISQASFDKTIKAVVKEIKDQTTGEYLIKYQDSEFTAYATSSQIHYQIGEEVYILIPGNDFMGVKRIIGSSNNKAIEYKELPVSSNLYNKVGTNVVSLSSPIGLSSYKYPEDNITISGLKIDAKAIKNYVRQGNSLAIGMTVKTSFAPSQAGGWYGLIFNLNFKDLNSNEENAVTTKPYIVSSRNIIGNPYAVTSQTPVEVLIKSDDIDVSNFVGIQSIVAFCQGFPTDESKETIKDIIISDIYLSGAEFLTDSELDGYLLNIDYSETGNIIDDEHSASVEYPIILKAELKIKGKVTNQDVEYYWFIQNGTIFRGSSKYYSKAGDGWECLNPYLNKTPIPFNTGEFYVIEPSQEDLPNRTAAVSSKVTKIKCVAVYENNAFSGECKVIDQKIQEVKIISSEQINGQNKTIYYLDNGSPTLTCKVYQPLSTEEYIVENNHELIYKWSVVPQDGKGSLVDSSPIDYEELYTNKQILHKAELMDEVSRTQYVQTREYLNALSDSKIEESARVERNIYYNFPIASINQSARVYCSVYDYDNGTKKERYLGSDSIVLENRSIIQGLYTLSLEHGTQVFQYDKKGNSPTSKQLEKPLKLQPLNFTLLDNQGKQITHTQIKNNGQIKWIYPNSQTLITTNYTEENYINGQYDFTVRGAESLPLDWENYNVIKDLDTFEYNIAESYDSKKNVNYIWLNIKYKNMIFNAYTNFTFPKDGDPGTNGTDFVIKLSPNNESERLYFSNQEQDVFADNGDNRPINTKLNLKLYNNSQLVQNLTVNSLECPIKKGQQNIDENNTFCSCNSGVIKRRNPNFYDLSDFDKALETIKDKRPIDIVRAKYTTEQITYYAEFPINYGYIVGEEKYRIKILPRTGFKYVVYSEDGTRPDYDNTIPFKVILEKQDQTYWIQEKSNLSFEWEAIGNLQVKTDEQGRGIAKPKDNFDGADLSNALICKIKYNNNWIGFIHIPIYMILNRYGHQALNDWDGNSIELNGAGNTILAPQIGAGVKDNRNRFTGVFMGAIEGLEDSQADSDAKRKGFDTDAYKIGLAGYHQGARTIFLDSKTGKAQFGKNNAGKITLDPSVTINGRDSALIYSGNYPIQDFLSPDQENSQAKYNVFEVGELEANRNKDNKGMIIDLSTPQIGFGSGNFTVNKKGHIVAKGGGQIAGWKITDTRLYNNNTGMASSDLKASDINANLPSSDASIAFHAGTSSVKNNFYVTHDGYLFSKAGQVAGWNIQPDRLWKNYTGMATSGVTRKQLEGGTSTASVAFFAGTEKNQDNFYVTHSGYLRSKSGKIASWNIDENKLSNGTVGFGIYTNNKGEPSSYSIKHGNNNFSVSNARIWSNNNFAVDNSGNLYSAAGYIGGWKIGPTSLVAANITMNANGSIKATGGKKGSWSINSDGDVYFNSGTIGGITIQSNKIGDAGGSWYISKSSVFLPNLQVKDGNVVYNVNNSGSGPNGISNQGGTYQVGNNGVVSKPGNTYTDKMNGETYKEYIEKLAVGELLYGTATGKRSELNQLTVYSGTSGSVEKGTLKASGDVLFSVTSNGVTSSVDFSVKPGKSVSFGGHKGESGTLTFSNKAWLKFSCGILYEHWIPSDAATSWS